MVVICYITNAFSIKESALAFNLSLNCPAKVLAARVRMCLLEEPKQTRKTKIFYYNKELMYGFRINWHMYLEVEMNLDHSHKHNSGTVKGFYQELLTITQPFKHDK